MKRFTISPDVLVRELSGETIILDLKTERYLGLDEVGTRMWSVLLASESVDSAYKKLFEEYEVEGNRLKGDLDEFIDKLIKHGLVTVDSDQEAA